MKQILFLLAISAAAAFGQETAASGEAPARNLFEILKWVNFLILAAGLGFLLFKNLPHFFRSRSESIQKEIAEAQQQKKDAEKRGAEMDARMSALGAEIEKFRVQSHAEMEREGERIRHETAAQIKKMEQQAAVEIESAGKAVRRELRTYAAELALNLAEQRIHGRLNPGIETALVDNFVSDLKKQGSKN